MLVDGREYGFGMNADWRPPPLPACIEPIEPLMPLERM